MAKYHIGKMRKGAVKEGGTGSSKRSKGGHTAPLARGAHRGIQSIMGKDRAAHSSHHENHGEGDQAGMHGFGPNFAPPEGGSGPGEMEGDQENCCMEE